MIRVLSNFRPILSISFFFFSIDRSILLSIFFPIRLVFIFSSFVMPPLNGVSRFAVTPCMSRHSHLTRFFPNSSIHGGFPFSPRAAPYVVGSLECLAYARATNKKVRWTDNSCRISNMEQRI